MSPLKKEGGGREGCTDPGPGVRALTLPLCTSVSPLARQDQKSLRRALQRPERASDLPEATRLPSRVRAAGWAAPAAGSREGRDWFWPPVSMVGSL